MSVPKIIVPNNPISREQAISDLLESIALEETGLAHIINAEGEKIQKIIENSQNIQGLLLGNESVNDTLKNIIKLQMLLQFKLDQAEKLDEDDDHNEHKC